MFFRKERRLKNFNYNGYGPYFVTICTCNRQKLFGKIEDNEFIFFTNELKKLFDNTYNVLENEFKGIKFNVYCTMPDHVHFIVSNASNGAFSLSDIVSRYKKLLYIGFRDLVNSGNITPYKQKLWQRDYYDHIIRREEDMEDCYNYIVNNPRASSFKMLLSKWNKDAENDKRKYMDGHDL